jgi:aminopeptidase
VAYEPPPELLERYARVLVRFALNNGKGVTRGDVVMISASDDAKPMYVAVRDEVYRAGGTVIADYSPAGTARSALETASLEQLLTFHRDYYRGLAKTLDHRIAIISTADPQELEGVDPKKLLAGRQSVRLYRSWMAKKEAEGRYSWTLALYGTPAMAKEARMPIAEYWQEIAKSCFLDDNDPIRRWREAFREIARIKRRLDALRIEELHVESTGIDLRVPIGESRRWLGGSGRNIPSFEVFTSPDWRGVEGTVTFNERLHRYGSLLEGIRLRFERGRVVEASAKRGEKMLQAMLASDAGSNAVGEISLTDGRVSPITRYMGETLFDENRGGPEGNFHLALGSAYRDAYAGDPSTLTTAALRRLGFNRSAVHTDIVSTTRRQVTARLPGGRRRVIYADGRFTV